MSDRLSYVLPIRSWGEKGETEELTEYLAWLAERADLVIVDGSERSSFLSHRDRWARFATHVPPAEDIHCANGKVRGVLTGLRLATQEGVVIADDDVRYDDESLARMGRLLAEADLVRPQNYFDPLDPARRRAARSEPSPRPEGVSSTRPRSSSDGARPRSPDSSNNVLGRPTTTGRSRFGSLRSSPRARPSPRGW